MSKMSFSVCSKRAILLLTCVWFGISTAIGSSSCGSGDAEGFGGHHQVVKREERKTLVSTEYGEISAARVKVHSSNSSYLLHFFTLDPNSLFLPVILHADMVFYVHTGSGRLSWTEEDEVKSTNLRRGDVYRLEEGAVFFIHSNLETETERQKLRIHAIFANSNKDDIHDEAASGPYSSIRDMVLGFDKKVLQAAFMVPEEQMEELLNGTKPPAIIHGVSGTKNRALEMEAEFIGSRRTYNILFQANKKKKKAGAKLFNLFKEDKDFENCNGWSTTVTRKKLSALKGTNIGLFMVNLTIGSMMGPHWNPWATEIAVVLQGRGMVRVVCSGVSNETGCRNMRYEVEEGDIFSVPRFDAMAQMAFNNETFVFMGFSTSAKANHPQFLAGQASVLRTLDKDVLAMAFNVTNTTMDQLLGSQEESVILGCISCAEEELRNLEEEIEKEKEAAREREEEEARKEEEEQRREEEEARKREEEEARKREEEEARRQEEERKRQEEEREEEAERKRREEEARKREEEAARREEEEREEEAARREEEERRRQEMEEAAAERKRQEKKKRQEEEEAERRRQEEEAARREEEERKRQEEEEEETTRKEEEARKTEEEEEREMQEEAAAAARRRKEEEEMKRREKEEMARREEEEKATREEEERQREEEETRGTEQPEEEEGGRSEEEQAEEEERRRQEEAEREEEVARRREEEGEGEEEEQRPQD